MKYITSILLFIIFLACKPDPKTKSIKPTVAKTIDSNTTQLDDNIFNRIPPPKHYKMKSAVLSSYEQHLQSLPLKPIGSAIKYFDGRIKSYFSEYVAVIDLPIGTKDLHQCADAVIRLRADYLWNTKQYDKIHFNFTNGMRVEYSNWMQGQRIKVKGNNTSWYQAQKASNTKEDYWNYLEQIWMYAGTLSLSKELKSRAINEIQIGDIFIQGGSPGHAVTVVNMSIHETTNEKIILLAQSYMPAQQTHILTNPYDDELSPWYSTQDLDQLHTPEWTFNAGDLKYFEN